MSRDSSKSRSFYAKSRRDGTMEEIWKDVAGYEGKYQISNAGTVRSLTRMTYPVDGRKPYIRHGQVIAWVVNRLGYPQVSIWANDGTYIKAKVHRLVADAFVDNPLALKEINHKDENKLNNRAENLEYCTHKYNMNFGTMRERSVKNRDYKAIGQKSSATQKRRYAQNKAILNCTEHDIAVIS